MQFKHFALNHKQILLIFGIPDLLSFLQAWKSNWNETFLLILRCREPGLLVHASAAKERKRSSSPKAYKEELLTKKKG